MGYESVRLFVERATAAAPGFALDERSAVDVARICLRLDGLPLALELAAGRVGALGPAAIAERLDDRFRVLRTGSHASPTRQHTLTATLQWSHDLLAPDERMLFRRLAVFAGGFELQAVESVCAGADLDPAGIADVLARLVEKSLVTVDEISPSERRYRLPETVRMYARERLGEAGETVALAERHARWALALAEADRTSPRLDREAANLRVALDTLLSASRPRHCASAWCCGGSGCAGSTSTRRGGDSTRRSRAPRSARRCAHGRCSPPPRSTTAAARSRAASPYAEESHAVASEIGDAHEQWRALQVLGEFGIASDAADVAMPWLERALELARREGFAAEEAVCVYSLGVAQWILGDPSRAEELVAESLRALPRARRLTRADHLAGQHRGHARRAGPMGGRASGSSSRRRCSRSSSCRATPRSATSSQTRRGSRAPAATSTRARELLAESASRFEAAADEPGRAAVLVRRAYLELAEDALPAARAALEEALELRRRQRDRRGTGLALAGLGLIDTTAGDYDSAERQLAEARRDLPARRRPLGPGEHAVADGRPRLRARAPRRRRGRAAGGAHGPRRDAAGALDRKHPHGTGRGRAAPRRPGAGRLRC